LAFRFLDAREQVLEHLDDESGARYARETGVNTESFRKVDRTLKTAISACVDEYVKAGGDRFNEIVEATTSASDGKASLAVEKLSHIRSVRVDNGTSLYRVEEGDNAAGNTPYLAERDLQMTVVRFFEPPQVPDPNDLLMGTVAGAARSWDAFDAWVCARAAKMLGIKDLEPSRQKALLDLVAELERAVMGHKRTPASKPWPERRPADALVTGRARWLWFPREQELQLVLGAR
jgi:hypothetical protein